MLATTVGFEAVLSILLIYFATFELDPADYGLYGLVIAYCLVAAGIAEGGAGLVVAHHWQTLDVLERSRLFTSQILISFVIAALFCMLLVLIWHERSLFLNEEVTSRISLTVLLISLGIIFTKSLQIVNICIFVIDGRSHQLAICNVIHSAALFTSTLVFIYVTDLSYIALFAGALCASSSVVAIGFVFLRSYLFAGPSRRHLRHARRLLPTTSSAAAAEGGRNLIEAALLTSLLSVALVGIWNHARLYHSMLLKGTNAVAHVVWHRGLAEARVEGSRFEVLRKGWVPLHVGITLTGVVFAMVGTEIVGLLTNDQFVEAAPFIPALLIGLLIQTSGRAGIAAVYAFGHGKDLLRVRTVLIVAAVATMPLVVPRWGIAGLIGIFLIEQMAYRAYVWRRATQIRPVPFHDGWVVGGAALIAAVLAAGTFTDLGFAVRGGIALVVCACTLFLARATVLESIRELRESLHGRQK